jgi:ABC-type glycerol-3-phosphate transport system substrate-binding protein
MKKIGALLLAFALLFSFAACGGSTESGSTSATTDENVSTNQ